MALDNHNFFEPDSSSPFFTPAADQPAVSYLPTFDEPPQPVFAGFTEPPAFYSEPQPVYTETPAFFTEPQPVYTEPQPVYTEPQAFSKPQPVYNEPPTCADYGKPSAFADYGGEAAAAAPFSDIPVSGDGGFFVAESKSPSSPGGKRANSQRQAEPDPIQSPYVQYGSPAWREDLCGCCNDMSSFCLAFWCPCIQLGINQANLRYARYQEHIPSPLPAQYSSDSELNGFLWGGGYWLSRFLSLHCIVGCINRSQLRQQFSIEGNECSDCCVHTFCVPCAIGQEAREINQRLHSPLVQCCQPPRRVLVVGNEVELATRP